MREFYTFKDICVYPGFNSVIIRKACEATHIDLTVPTRKKRQHGREVDAFTREEFEKIMEHHGYELIETKDGKFWVRYMTPDM